MVSSPPRACFFGLPQMGSWQIRARQMATARRGWSSRTGLDATDIIDHEVFCAIKRPFASRLRLLQRLGKVALYDVLDCWRQPEEGLQFDDLDKVRRHFVEWFAGLPLDGVIFPNRQMLADLGDLVPDPVCIYHHYWPGLQPIEVREQARVVGYQGQADYLGPWQQHAERACSRLGLQFVINPVDLRSVDIGFTARGGVHASLMAHRYKSNVKLANFYGAAIPCVVHRADCAYVETDNGEVRFFDSAEQLQERLAELLPYETRLDVHRSFVDARAAFSLEAIAAQYEAYFGRQLERKAGRVAGARAPSR